MRVSTAFAFARTQEEITHRQAMIAKAQDQLSTGMKVQTPSDDPYAAAQAERARSFQVRLDIERRSSGFARSTLSAIEGALGNTGDVLQQVRSQMLGVGNAALSQSDRSAIATQLSQMRSELLGIANRSDGSGAYLFGGQGSRSAPFLDGQPVSYLAQAGEQTTGQDMPAELAINGAASFTALATSTGPLNVFSVIDAAINVLKDTTVNAASLNTVMQPIVASLDQGLDASLAQRATVGERLRALDDHDQYLDATEQNSKSYSAQITEVDLAVAISDLNAQQTTLQAVLKSYSQISRMSLFDYMR